MTCFWTDVVLGSQVCESAPPPGPSGDLVPLDGHTDNYYRAVLVGYDHTNDFPSYAGRSGSAIAFEPTAGLIGNRFVFSGANLGDPWSTRYSIALVSADLYELPRVVDGDLWYGDPYDEGAFVTALDVSATPVGYSTPPFASGDDVGLFSAENAITGLPALDPAHVYFVRLTYDVYFDGAYDDGPFALDFGVAAETPPETAGISDYYSEVDEQLYPGSAAYLGGVSVVKWLFYDEGEGAMATVFDVAYQYRDSNQPCADISPEVLGTPVMFYNTCA